MVTTFEADVDPELKEQAERIFANAGVSAGEVFQRVLVRTVERQSVPLDLWEPNAETIAAMQETRAGHLRSFATLKDLIDDLNEEDD